MNLRDNLLAHTDFIEPIQYYLVKTGGNTIITKDLAIITDQLGTYNNDGIALKREEFSLTIYYNDMATKSVLSIDNAPLVSDTSISGQITLTCEKNDSLSLNMLRNIVKNMGYRIFNPELGCYISNDSDLLDLTTFTTNSKITKIIADNGFKPLFNYRNSLIFFAKKAKDDSVYQINSHLLLHLAENAAAPFKEKDFYKKVAPDLGHFIALYDKGMVQGNFYSKTGKIVNQSGFNVNRLKRSVFVRPVFFRYSPEKQSFVQISRTLDRRDSLAPGTSVRAYATSVLDQLKIQGKYTATKVTRNIGYEKNLQGKLTPRLNVVIFVD